MKKHLFLLMAVFSVFLFTACSSGSPTSVAKNFSENMAKGKYEEAKKYCSEPTGKLLDMAGAFGGGKVDPDFKFQPVGEEIDGDKATVTFKKNEEGDEDTIDLIKVDGKWKVHIDMKK